jgi:hypothetical protein
MRRAIVALALLALVTTPVMADNVARNGYIEGTYTQYENQIGDRGTALVVSVIEGTFTDQAEKYAAALENAGHAVDIIYDPMGAWPDLDPYCLVLVTTADNWWGYNWMDADEAVLAAYLDSGGKVIFISQDYLYFRPMGHIGFPMDYLGVCGVILDPTFGDEGDLDWEGTAGSILAGLFGTLPGAIGICYESNSFFADEVTPCTIGLALWTTPMAGPFPFMEGGAVEDATVFNTFDFSCAPDPADLDVVIGIMVEYLGAASPVEDTSWGSIKGMFR